MVEGGRALSGSEDDTEIIDRNFFSCFHVYMSYVPIYSDRIFNLSAKISNPES